VNGNEGLVWQVGEWSIESFYASRHLVKPGDRIVHVMPTCVHAQCGTPMLTRATRHNRHFTR
jgi:hypothetical protein